MSERIELGCAGHLIVAASCHYRRHTQVAHYRISTVGNYFLPNARERSTVGFGGDSFFETMVFPTSDAPSADSEGCGCREVLSWTELECVHYATAGAAHTGHEAMVAKYLNAAPWVAPKEDAE